MKRICLIIILLIFYWLPIQAQNEFDLGEKKVIGEDKSKVTNDLKVIKVTNQNHINQAGQELKLREEAITLPDNRPDISRTATGPTNSTPFSGALKNENNFIFGLGGFKQIDAFNYSIDYSKKDEDKDLTYIFNIKRDIRGVDRRNSDIDQDHFNGDFIYKQFGIGLTHDIKDEDFPGRISASSNVNTFKQETSSAMNLNLNILFSVNNTIKITSELYEKKVSSDPTPVREYNNTLYKIDGIYETFLYLGSLKELDEFQNRILSGWLIGL